MSFLADSDRIIDYLTDDAGARTFLQGLVPRGVARSAVSHMEVLEGIIAGRDPQQTELVDRRSLTVVKLLDLDQAVAERAARLRALLRQQKRPVKHRALNLIIAATAIEHDLLLVTRNVSHFHDVPGLRLHTDD